MLKDSLPNGKWEKYWSLRYSLLAATALADYYVNGLHKVHGAGFNHVVIVHRNGVSTAFVHHDQRETFGKALIAKYVKNHKMDFDALIKQANEMRLFHEQKDLRTFVEKYAQYVAGVYIIPRCVIDFSEDVDELRDQLAKVRLYTEQIPVEGDEYMLDLLGNVMKNSQNKLMYPELISYYKTGELPSEKQLLSRNNCAIIYTKKGFEFITDPKTIDELEEINIDSKEISGKIAFSGENVVGTARIIFDPENYEVFNEGDVLVTGMTRPDFVPLMKQSSAIVTDGGGLLCHAAIVAREFGKPCVIGTQFATKLLKDGDRIEVDSVNGKIKVL